MTTPDSPRPSPQNFSECMATPPPRELLDQPLDFIFAEHVRHRCILTKMRALGDGEPVSRDDADLIGNYLKFDVALHHRDEDDDLFPLVRKRALPADSLGDVLDRLGNDHSHIEPLIARIVSLLGTLAVTDPIVLTLPKRRLMQDYVRSEHRHLAIENGIVLVIARKRLTPVDLKTLSHAMKARREVTDRGVTAQ